MVATDYRTLTKHEEGPNDVSYLAGEALLVRAYDHACYRAGDFMFVLLIHHLTFIFLIVFPPPSAGSHAGDARSKEDCVHQPE